MATAIKILIGVTVYGAMGVLAYGMAFNYFQSGWVALAFQNRGKDRALAAILGASGPMGLTVALILSGTGKRVGLRYRAVSADESWREFNRQWPSLTRNNWKGIE